MTSFKPEVIADSTGTWNSNALRFASEEECKQYLADLFMRWTSVRETRATACEDLPTHFWKDGRAIEIAKFSREELAAIGYLAAAQVRKERT